MGWFPLATPLLYGDTLFALAVAKLIRRRKGIRAQGYAKKVLFKAKKGR
jgi:hypothetical protein